jgi:hypothetical protein
VRLHTMQSADGLEISEISRRRWHRLAAPLVPRCPPPSPRTIVRPYETEAQATEVTRARKLMNSVEGLWSWSSRPRAWGLSARA